MAANRNNPPETPPADETPEPTTVKVQATLPIAGLFARGQTRTVELTPFVQGAINNGKLVIVE